MLEAVGHPVVALRRTRYAASVRAARPGDWRELTRDEVRRLRARESVSDHSNQTSVASTT